MPKKKKQKKKPREREREIKREVRLIQSLQDLSGGNKSQIFFILIVVGSNFRVLSRGGL